MGSDGDLGEGEEEEGGGAGLGMGDVFGGVVTLEYTTSNQGEPKKPKSVNHNRPTSATSEQTDQKCH